MPPTNPATSTSGADRLARPRADAGFSLIELLVVVGLTAVIMAIAALAMPLAARSSKADGEMQRIIGQLRRAKHLALTERRNYLVQFPSDFVVSVSRQDVAGAVVTGTTLRESSILEGGYRFLVFPEHGDTPDAFGNGSARSFGAATQVLFTSEGTLVDQTGDVLNGSIFIGQTGEPLSARAVTIFGPTGLVRGFRWTGREWVN